MQAKSRHNPQAAFSRGLCFCGSEFLLKITKGFASTPQRSVLHTFRAIQPAAARTTAWTTARDLRTLRAMTTKRSKYDPLALSRLPRWLVLRDMFHNVLDSTELPPGTDLRQAFASGLAALERQGWYSEGASGAMVFVRRG